MPAAVTVEVIVFVTVLVETEVVFLVHFETVDVTVGLGLVTVIVVPDLGGGQQYGFA
jgi:hypothetical protein